jgi:hypothetical protein
MDNPDTGNANGNNDLDKPIPLDGGSPAPAKEDSANGPAVSRAPLNLGGPAASGARPSPAPPRPMPLAAASARPRVQAPQAPVRRPVAAAPAATGRIANCKTFFTKLHPGAVEFLDEQICGWLHDNPNVVIKHTNVVVGEVQAKKTEPNILITVWY